MVVVWVIQVFTDLLLRCVHFSVFLHSAVCAVPDMDAEAEAGKETVVGSYNVYCGWVYAGFVVSWVSDDIPSRCCDVLLERELFARRGN